MSEEVILTSRTWQQGYIARGLKPKLSSTAQKVLWSDSEYIANRCILDPSEEWAETRIRTGLVIGAVQSGKTASMLAVSSLLLDRKPSVDILIVLAGRTEVLWRQTYQRLLRDLDGTTTDDFYLRWDWRQIIPRPEYFDNVSGRGTGSYLVGEEFDFQDALEDERPVIFIVPKVASHLIELQEFLRDNISGAVKRRLSLVMLDDEADDGGVLDAAENKCLPNLIEGIYTQNSSRSTFLDNLYATYVAYTATPAANALQYKHNPLYPRDFIVALRTPYREGDIEEKREPTYRESSGITRYYCGGQMFYQDAGLVETIAFPSADGLTEDGHRGQVRHAADKLMLDALRCYLVAAAIRLLHHTATGGLAYSQIQKGASTSNIFPPMHTMLLHPSAQKQDHESECRRLILLCQGINPDDPEAEQHPKTQLSVSGLTTLLHSDPSLWSCWRESFEQTRKSLQEWPKGSTLLDCDAFSWSQIETVLRTEIFPHVKLRIINSDQSNSRPDFQVRQEDEIWLPPEDILTIFVAGNVMSRGLTVEGLHTTVFTRTANTPAEDTQMQMQRWFGYRTNASIHLCRLFCYTNQYALFKDYHRRDTYMRKLLTTAMNKDTVPRNVSIFAANPDGSNSILSAKVSYNKIPLFPGANKYLTHLETNQFAESNARHLNGILSDGDWYNVSPGNTVLGQLRREPYTLLEVANILDGFRYSYHTPDPDGESWCTRWKHHQHSFDLSEPLFRPPQESLSLSFLREEKECPYNLAAYFRFWNTLHHSGRMDLLNSFWSTHNVDQPWNMYNLPLPKFYIGIRYGGHDITHWANAELPHLKNVRTRMSKKWTEEASGLVRMNSRWGSRGSERTERYDDAHFDFYHPDVHFNVESGPRPLGQPGLILLQVIRVMCPNGNFNDAVTFGFSLPKGSPTQYQAIPIGDYD